MSDTAAPAAVETAAPPVAEPAAPAPAAPQGTEATAPAEQTPSGPLNRNEARAQARQTWEAAKAAATDGAAEEAATPADGVEPKVDAKGRKHDPKDGKYLPGTGEEAASEDGDEHADPVTSEPGEEPASAQAPSDGEEATDDAAEPAVAQVTVTIPKDHPVAQMGRDAISVATEQDAEQVRALINGTYARRQEVENLTSEKAELHKKYMELQKRVVQMESRDAAQKTWMQTPQYKAAVTEYQEIKETVGPEAASRYWAGIQGDLQKLQETEESTRWEAVEAKEAEEVGQRFATQAYQKLEKLPEYARNLPDVKRWFNEELQLFNQRAENGDYNHIESWEDLQAEFSRGFARRLVSEPAVIAAAEAAKKAKAGSTPAAPAEPAAAPKPDVDLEQVKREAVEAYKRELAEKRQAAPPNPLGSIPDVSGANARSASAPADGPQDQELSRMSPGDRKRHFRNASREVVRHHLGT